MNLPTLMMSWISDTDRDKHIHTHKIH
jgi:hypothetical protein